MERKDLIIGVHGAGETGLKERFGSVSAFSDGLKKGFEQCGVQAYSVKECVEQSKNPHLTIGFQAVENETWQTILTSGRPNIMWTLDSAFWKNTEYLDQFANYDNFVGICGKNRIQQRILMLYLWAGFLTMKPTCRI